VFAFSGLMSGASLLTSTTSLDRAILNVKSNCLFLTQARHDVVILPRIEASRFQRQLHTCFPPIPAPEAGPKSEIALGTSAMWSADGFCLRTRYSVGRCASSLASARTSCWLRHLHAELKLGPATRTLRLAGFEMHKRRRPRKLCVCCISQSALSKPRPIVFAGQSRHKQERINTYAGNQIAPV